MVGWGLNCRGQDRCPGGLGGETRQASVAQGLGYDAGGARPDWIVIHDGVRPFVDVQLIEAVKKKTL